MRNTAVGPPFPYYGSKTTLAPWILDFIPEHRNYVEPFAGSAAVLMAKNRSPVEVINDLDGDVVNFWRVLRNRPDDLIDILQLTPYARDEFLESREAHGGTELEQARRFFVKYCMSFNSTNSTRTGFSRTTARGSGNKTLSFVRRVDDRLAWVAERIRLVEIENMDALKLIDLWRDPRTVLYMDPPYLRSTRNGRGYVVESDTDEFHSALIDAVADFPGTVLLSGYRGGPYEQLGWHCETKTVAAHSSTIGSARPRRVECLWMNRTP